jgi:hypothetical protein
VQCQVLLLLHQLTKSPLPVLLQGQTRISSLRSRVVTYGTLVLLLFGSRLLL